jgi:protein-tyrosine phosphatase
MGGMSAIWTPEGAADPTKIDIRFDPREQRMRGYAAHGNTPFDVPFISQITETLWTGGCTDGLVLPDHIEHVISLYPWESYTIRHEAKSVLAIRMYDSLDQAMGQVEAIADWVNVCRADGPTLVHCQAGLNRSGLVAAMALIRGGMEAHEAILLLREKRSPAVLCNEAFQAWLFAYDGKTA